MHPAVALWQAKVGFPPATAAGVRQHTGVAPVQVIGARPPPQGTGVAVAAALEVEVEVARLVVAAVAAALLVVPALVVVDEAPAVLAELLAAVVAAFVVSAVDDAAAAAVVPAALLDVPLLLVAPGVKVGAPTCSSSELSLQATANTAADVTAKTIPAIFIRGLRGPVVPPTS